MAKTKFAKPSEAVLAAKKRRAWTDVRRGARFEWFLEKVVDKVKMTMEERVRLATHYIKDKVVENLKTPVVKGKGPRGGRVITGRSKSGEFPHAETTQLMKSIFDEYRVSSSGFEGFVGTPLDYGIILEVRMNRRFLSRTLFEHSLIVKRMLSGPIRK